MIEDSTDCQTWPCYSEEEAQAVKDVLLSNKVNYWTGQECKLFEAEFADFVDRRHAITMANGTVVLEAALKALEIGPGDEVIVTPRTFIASASCIIAVGASPVFADVDLDSQNITAESIDRVATQRTKAVICVHLAGWPCEMDEIVKWAADKSVAIIEDCAQSHGAVYKDRPVGSHGVIGCWSFCQDKIMTTGGEGGMVATDDSELWSKMWSLKDHGKSWHAVQRDDKPGFRWLHESFGTNWRMTELQAVLGRIQLTKLPQWSKKRNAIAHAIWDSASDISGLRVPLVPDHIFHAAYTCYLFVDSDALKNSWDRDRIIAELEFANISAYSGSCSEIYLEKAFDQGNLRPNTPLKNARELGETSIMFKINPNLTAEHVERTVQALRTTMHNATRLKPAASTAQAKHSNDSLV